MLVSAPISRLVRTSCWQHLSALSSVPVSRHHPSAISRFSTGTVHAYKKKNEVAWEVARAEYALLPKVTPDEFRLLKENNLATLDHVKACLWHNKQRLEQLSLEDQRAICAKGHLGGLALHWLWTQDKVCRGKLADRDVYIIDLICELLVAEGRVGRVLQWLKLEYSGRPTSSQAKNRSAQIWLACMARAHFEWTGGATPAPCVELLRTAISLLGPTLFPGQKSIYIGILAVLRKVMSEHTTDVYDAKLFDFWYHALTVLELPQIAVEHQARGLLFHPTKPNAIPWFRHVTGDSREAEVMWSDASFRGSAAHGTLRAWYILQNQGHHAAAAELWDLVKKRSPEVFQSRRYILAQLEADPKLQSLR